MSRLLLAALAALALVPAAPAGGPALVAGAAEESVRQTDLTKAKASMTLLRLAGFRAVRVTSTWVGGQTTPGERELGDLRNAVSAASLTGVRVYVAVTHAGAKTTPAAAASRKEFAAFTAAVAKAFPSVRDVIVGQEPNSDRSWLPQFGPKGENAAAAAYLALLAETYDALKAASPGVTVWGGALAAAGSDRAGAGGTGSHSAAAFVRGLGAAYRASGRTKPVMDGLALRPYASGSGERPDLPHPLSGTLGLADYGRLVAALGKAFAGTQQPGSALPVLYDDVGVETAVPETKRSLYVGAEPRASKPVAERTQAAWYRRALELAFCQPTVSAILLGRSQDEPSRAFRQSGLYYADGSAKTSLAPTRAALASARGGSVAHCPGLLLAPKLTLLRFPTVREARSGSLGIRLRCDLDCAYSARLLRLPAGSTTLAKRGRAVAGAETLVTLGRRVAPGRYRFALTIGHPVNPGEPVTRLGAPFRLP